MAKVKKEFKLLNIKCEGCASTVIKKLSVDYDNVKVNLELTPRVVTITTDENFDESVFKQKVKSLGYPSVDESLGTFEEIGTKAKSFVSCAVGKMDNK